MRSTPKRLGMGNQSLLKRLTIIFAGITLLARPGLAQNPGSPLVFSTSGTVAISNAYIDASGSGITGSDICQKLHNALLQLATYPGGAGVIDARGVSLNPCNSAPKLNPWSGISTPSVVLLPAGTIQIFTTWTLPAGTRLIGEGGEDPGLSMTTTSRTIIQAQGPGFPSPVLQMGTSVGCRGVSIEDVVVDGMGAAIDGIDNVYCQDQSYVDHVTIFRVLSIGINVSSNAANSGPYTNITFDTFGLGGSSSVTGAYLNYGTRGIQGMTCTTGNAVISSSPPGVCINVAAPGNSIEDVRIEGFTTGINVGASNTVLMNIDGDTNPNTSATTLNVVEIVSSVTDVALIGITNNCNSPYCSGDSTDSTIIDNTTSPATQLLAAKDPFVAMYVVGDTVTVNSAPAYARYTTSPNLTNWSVGSAGVNGSCTAPGSLYSNTSGSPNALYVCSAVSGSSYKTWAAVE
jgi:hypothetical protein